MNKNIGLIFIALAILASGCVSTTTISPVTSGDLIVSTEPIVMKEFQEQQISVIVLNNNTSQPIDSVSVSSFGLFTVLGDTSNINIPATKQATVNARIQAPAFDSVEDTTMLTISYTSGLDEDEKPVIQTKNIPVQTVVLPDAELQFVGFVEDIDNLLATPPVSTWEAEKGENVTVKFSVKNSGQSTIPADSLVVYIDIENELIGGNASFNITQAMARGGTSYTRGVELLILEDAPNGETDVSVTLMQGDYVLDTQSLVLKVKL
ncbi:hypothetical protein [Methanococcoides methylutens]|uniref:hypothetical protein n=1 Tax=Methanococcoides methylutens TaxID=2226 RepID=UPI00064E4623|nr:hypothetical protein [Methanococcoides methylutens]